MEKKSSEKTFLLIIFVFCYSLAYSQSTNKKLLKLYLKDKAKAEEYCKKKKNEKQKNCYYQLANLYYEDGLHLKSLTYYKLSGKEAEGYWKIANYEYNKEQYSQALENYNQAYFKKDADKNLKRKISLQMGYCYIALNDFSRAIKNLELAFKTDTSGMSRAYKVMADSLFNFSNRKSYLTISFTSKTAKQLIEFYKKGGQENLGYERAGDLFFKYKPACPESFDYYEKAFVDNPGKLNEKYEISANELMKLGKNTIGKGYTEYKDALKKFNRAISLYKKVNKPYYGYEQILNCCLIYLVNKKEYNIIEEYREKTKNPQEYNEKIAEAYAQAKYNEFNKAMEYYKKAYGSDLSKIDSVYEVIAQSYLNKNHYYSSYNVYKKRYKNNPTLLKQNTIRIADKAFNNNALAKAFSLYKTGYSNNPKSLNSVSLELAEKAIDVKNYRLATDIYLFLEDYDKAKHVADQLISNNPRIPDYNLALTVYEEIMNQEGIEKCYKHLYDFLFTWQWTNGYKVYDFIKYEDGTLAFEMKTKNLSTMMRSKIKIDKDIITFSNIYQWDGSSMKSLNGAGFKKKFEISSKLILTDLKSGKVEKLSLL